jgi:nucleoid-associated protein YgaU
MGRDFKIGLICGLIPAVAALVWVATRPSLSPEARMMRSSQVQSQAAGAPATPGPAPGDNRADRRQSTERTTAPPAVTGSVPNPPSATNLPDLTIYEQPEKIKTTRFHIVRREETLSSISQQYFGSPNQWRKILEANKKVVPDANKLQPGTKLIIPD